MCDGITRPFPIFNAATIVKKMFKIYSSGTILSTEYLNSGKIFES